MPEKPLVLQKIEEWQNLVEARNWQVMQKLEDRWSTIYSLMREDMTEFVQWMEDHPEQAFTFARMMQDRRYQTLLAQARENMRAFRFYADDVISAEQAEMLNLGIASSADLITAGFEGAGVQAPYFDVINATAVDYMIGFSADGTPLADLLETSYPGMVEGITGELINGLARGIGTRATADNMAGWVNETFYQRALMIARTEQMRALRTGSIAEIKASRVCEGYYRRSQRASNVCPSCIALDGKFYPLTNNPMAGSGEELLEFDSHPNCACYIEPAITGYGQPEEINTSRDWFNGLPESQQEQMLGKSLYQAYKDGNLDWDEIPRIEHDPVWGATIRQATLKELGIDRYKPPPKPKQPRAPTPKTIKGMTGNVNSIFNTSPEEASRLNEQAHNFLRKDYVDYSHKQGIKNDINNMTIQDIKNSIVTTLSDRGGVTYNTVNDIVHNWACTSNDTDLRSLGIQEIAERKFNAPLSPWQREQLSRVRSHGHHLGVDYAFGSGGKSGTEVVDEILGQMYSFTQESLKANGIQEVVLYRGVSLDDFNLEDIFYSNEVKNGQFLVRTPRVKKPELLRNSIESWSSDRHVADSFGGGHHVTLMIRVPIEDVLSCSRTGFGCTDEAEWVLINRPRDIVVISQRGQSW